MKEEIANNMFELYELIGASNQSLKTSKGCSYVMSANNSWPTKVFRLNELQIDYGDLYQKMEFGEIPDSVFLNEDEVAESQLVKHGFKMKSTILSMYANLSEQTKSANSFTSIDRVDTEKAAAIFAKIASVAFSYEVRPETIASLINNPKLKIYIGKYKETYASSGMLLLDRNGISGLHMIGTLPEYRGYGLGKVMTGKLLFEAYENSSKQAVLGASELGHRVYSKLGFKVEGTLKSYSI
ncbi:GNAT family N-acetyltransferase [Flavivirga eckloniae]|uniref:N-acetyltransferase domain-containing protein n=1 Tax=Flavivirga eckloniae TaxID=1803846 RepID=A0A2K9PVY6_9FLAO|nr:GNAT family N-acetyltransferase [Flavivirga eckloniae]AUP80988.1 hypothetical protein C1H87_20640 [Flavivirga eckloniae]